MQERLVPIPSGNPKRRGGNAAFLRLPPTLTTKESRYRDDHDGRDDQHRHPPPLWLKGSSRTFLHGDRVGHANRALRRPTRRSESQCGLPYAPNGSILAMRPMPSGDSG
jgi:hypothetical protein